MPRISKFHYHVAPRYTPGSPAMVNHIIAERVAKEEKRAYEQALTGFYGEADLKKAQQLGLRGIVEERTEKPKGWEVYDLCTEERLLREYRDKLTKKGWRQYSELAPWEKALVDAETLPVDKNYAWLKIELARFGESKTGYKVTVYRETLLEAV